MPVSLKVFREAFTTLSIGIVGSLGAGLILSGMSGTLAQVAGLALILPAALGARGTIYGALSSKISSAMHMGRIKGFSWDNAFLRKSARDAQKATIFISFLLAFIAVGLANVSGIPANPFLLFFISVVSGLISGAIMIVVTNFIAFQAFTRGWDPDNLSAPLIASIGDFVTVPVLFGSALLAQQLPQELLIFIFVLGTIYILWDVRSHFLTAHFIILVASVSVQTFAGIFLERSVPTLVALVPGILIFLPAFLSQGGNLSSFIASRLATQLHLGILTPRFALKKPLVNEMLTVSLLSILIFPLLAFAAFIIQQVLHIPHVSLFEMLRIILEAGFLNTLLVAVVLGFSVSIISWRLDLDPDDVTIPILSSTADLFGILFLLLVI